LKGPFYDMQDGRGGTDAVNVHPLEEILPGDKAEEDDRDEVPDIQSDFTEAGRKMIGKGIHTDMPGPGGSKSDISPGDNYQEIFGNLIRKGEGAVEEPP
jgi:hypothetical protein